MDQWTLTTPAATGPRRPALNLRPCPTGLRDALRVLAQAEGEELYKYALRVLREHVDDRRRPAHDHASV
jgi:hypothetical protein